MELLTDHPRQLIVNADDSGRTERINEGVEEAFRNGLVSSTSLVANSPAFPHALGILRRNPSLDVGIHLSLHEYPPLTENAYLNRLATRSMPGAFARVALAAPCEIRLIEEEFKRQIEKILSTGVRLSHIDGHNHIHVHPRLIAVLVRLAHRYSIRWIRLPAEAVAHGRNVRRTLEKMMLTTVCRFDALFMKNTLSWPIRFHGFSESGNLNRDRLLQLLKRVGPGLNELVCHVGTENDDPPFRIGYHWRDELRAMTSFSKKQVKEDFGIHVVSYREIEQ